LFGKLSASGARRVSPPFVLVAWPPADAIAAACRDRTPKITTLEALPRLENRGMMPMIEAALEHQLSSTRCGHHRLGFVKRPAKRLFAKHVLAGLQRGDRYLGVNVGRSAHDDGIDVGALDRASPVGGPGRAGELLHEALGWPLVGANDLDQLVLW